MFPFASLLTTLLLAMSIAASPVEVRDSPVTLPVARQLNLKGGTVNLVQHDQARAASLKDTSSLSRRAGSIPVINEAVSYIAEVAVGSPATTCELHLKKFVITYELSVTDYLIVDTGSSNTWVGASTPYTMTSTSYDTGEPVAVSYGSGSFSGMT